MTLLTNIWTFISLKILAPINWDGLKAMCNHGKYYDLTDFELDLIRRTLNTTNCIGLSRRKTHLTTYLIAIASFITTGKWSYWTHAFMNIEGDSAKDDDYRLVEATAPGTHYSKFMEVFDCDSACLLIPKNFTLEKWADVCASVPKYLGTAYDTLFDYKDATQLDCIELIRIMLMAEPNYATDFANFEALIQSKKELTPQMLFDCPDFQRLVLIKH